MSTPPESGADTPLHPPVESIQDHSDDARLFYEHYVATRQPCIIRPIRPIDASNAPDVALNDNRTIGTWYLDAFVAPPVQDVIATWLRPATSNSAVSPLVQVERRCHHNERFGHARTAQRQVLLPLDTFVREYCGCHIVEEPNDTRGADSTPTKVSAKNDASLYYLSTQEDPADHACHISTFIPPTPYWSAPCRRLRDAGLLPQSFPLAGHLRLHQCQVWMGCVRDTVDTTTTNTKPTHSGLHHDVHDNFYTVLAGVKEFVLYPPSDAPHLALHGTIDTMHPNGVISYRNADAPIQADGRPQMPANTVGRKRSRTAPSHDENDEDENQNDESDDEESVVLGKGFDYQSDDDDNDNEVTGTDDYDAYCRDDSDNDTKGPAAVTATNDSPTDSPTDTTPNHFSWIDPVSATRDAIVATHPAYAHTTPRRIRLGPGETLYLPASWCHCVTSAGSSSAGDGNDSTNSRHSHSDSTSRVVIPPSVHVAINYWYHPPDNLTEFQHPYQNREYWEQEASNL